MGDLDSRMMARAIELAKMGDPSPNPHVGCVLARADKIVGEGFHEAAGMEHAEIVALRSADKGARGATLYSTLEPCNHEGKTAPCVDAIINAGIRRVVVAARDPNPNVPGGGVERLREAGIEVSVGVLEKEAAAIIVPWKKYVTTKTAFLSVKLAVSLDGRIATRTGASKWITGQESRARVHALRNEHDAVLVGINTVLADDPALTVRDAPGRNPVRVVVDSNLRMPIGSQLVTSAEHTPTCVVTTLEASRAVAETLESAGVSIIRVPATAQGRCDMLATLKELAAREVVTVLCEGGAELTGSLLATRLVDQLHVFIAPVLLGPRGRPAAVDWAGPEHPSDAPRLDSPRWELCGADAYVEGPVTYSSK